MRGGRKRQEKPRLDSIRTVIQIKMTYYSLLNNMGKIDIILARKEKLGSEIWVIQSTLGVTARVDTSQKRSVTHPQMDDVELRI